MRRVFAWAAMLVASAAASAGVPADGVETTVGPGERIYSDVVVTAPQEEGDYAIAQGNTGPLTRDGHSVKTGDLLVEIMMFLKGGPALYWCIPTSIERGTLHLPKKAVCLSDHGQSGKLTDLRVEGYKRSASFRVIPYVIQTGYHDDPEGTPRTIEREILYEGVAAGVLKVSYRERVDSMARPAFDQQGSFDISPNGPTIFRFKGAVFEVSKADNLGITYRVSEGLAKP